MKLTFNRGIAAGAAVAAIAIASTPALAGSGAGAPFNLGVENIVNRVSVLKGTTGDAQLRVNNRRGGDAAIAVHGLHSGTTGYGAGVYGETNSDAAGASGVFGRASSASSATNSAAVRGVNNGNGMGVFGTNGFGVATSYGVLGEARYGLVGTGLFKGASSGLFGSSQNGFAGVEGHSGNANGYGVYGRNTAGGAGVYGTSSAAAAVSGNNTGAGYGAFGKSETGAGVHGLSTFDGVFGETKSANNAGVSGHGGVYGVWGVGETGVYGKSNAGGFALDADGDAVQNRAGSGLVKAALLYDPHAPEHIVACFNSSVPGADSSIPPCGITDSGGSSGRFFDFGFKVSDRFVMVTPVYDGGDIKAQLQSFDTGYFGNDKILVETYYSSRNFFDNYAYDTPAPLYIVVF